MFERVIACLDGSAFAEAILPIAKAMTDAAGGEIDILRVVEDAAEIGSEGPHLQERARQYSARLRFAVSLDTVSAIRNELVNDPSSTAALTTHGRGAALETVMGSVAFNVLREARRPALLFRPKQRVWNPGKRIKLVAAALDGTRFSEKILPHAVKAARSLSAGLLLLHALPAPIPLSAERPADFLESSYLQRKAAEVRSAYDVEAQWEVLHGEPGDAICRYLKDMPETLLAMTTHARPPLQRVVLGSVATHCLGHAGVPLLLYWPQ
jgi:nucleotide-binding universal stress UspA family protein